MCNTIATTDGDGAGAGSADVFATITAPVDPSKWVKERIWSYSGNKLLLKPDPPQPQLHQPTIVFPTSTQQVSDILKQSGNRPVASVCGGHEASNVALFADNDKNSIILDLCYMKDITVTDTDTTTGGGVGGNKLVTVSAGVLFRELVDVVHEAGGALPVGTGADVGVMGYILNGGISGYFSRRLGLLSQRVVRMTVVDSSGVISHLTQNNENDQQLFTAMLGAGSALGIVTEITLRMEDASIVQAGKQYVFAAAVSDDGGNDNKKKEALVRFSRSAMEFMRSKVLPNESLSMEIVVTGNNNVVITVVFYDTFVGGTATDNIDSFCDPILRQVADDEHIALLVHEAHWTSWYEVASALWPVIAEMKGTPLAMLQHCCGTEASPTDVDLDFLEQVWIGSAPFSQANMTIVEARTLGGAIKKQNQDDSAAAMTIPPSGNCHHDFFVDMIVAYDAGTKSLTKRQAIADQVSTIVNKARMHEKCSSGAFHVDFSGTHSQLDDTNGNVVKANTILGDEKAAQNVSARKREMDPENRFRFHPFAKIIT